MSPNMFVACFCLLACANAVLGRDLLVEVISGKVKRMDTLSTDAYMSVTVCSQKQKTQVIKRSLNPVWNWRHQFTNVNDNCKIKFHLYDEEILERDDTIGEFETTVGEFVRGRQEQSTLTFGKHGDSNVRIRVRYV